MNPRTQLPAVSIPDESVRPVLGGHDGAREPQIKVREPSTGRGNTSRQWRRCFAAKARPPAACERSTSAECQPMRVSRGTQVIGNWSSSEVEARLKSGDLFLTDSFYAEDVSDWLPLSELQDMRSPVKPEKPGIQPCYCGSSLPFQVCCGDGRNY
jgi:hypothetical protein